MGLLLITASYSIAQSDNDKKVELEARFKNSPDEPRPRVWWHWMNGNITKEDIRANLEWMRHVGVAGSPGWSESGGPWVRPAEGMKKYVCTKTMVEAVGRSPASYHNLPQAQVHLRIFLIMWELQPIVTSNGGKVELSLLTDGNISISSILAYILWR